MTDPLTDVNPFEDLSYAEVLAELNNTKDALMNSSYSNFDRVFDFQAFMGTSINQWPPTPSEILLRHGLIEEEFTEVSNEFHTAYRDIEKKKVAKELADLLYVVYGTAVSFGIDIDRVFKEVHKSNMSKLVDGKPLRREDGKVLKGPNYLEPDLSFVV